MSTQAILPFLRALGAAPPPGLPAAPPPDPSANFSSQEVASGAPDGSQQNAAAPSQPVETKGHKLLRILQGGLVGGLNGLANDAQIYAQTGRNAGFGGGFQGAEMLPFLQAQREQQLQQGQAGLQATQAETAQKKAQTQQLTETEPFLMPNGMPVMIPKGQAAKFAAQLAKGQSAENVQGQKGQTATTVQGMKSQTAENVAKINQGNPIPLDETVANLIGMPEAANMPVGKGTLDNINKMLTAKGYKTQDLGTDGMWLLDKAGNRIKRIGDSPSLARAQARPVQVADESNPGNTKFVSGATAIATGAAGPQSASVVVPRQAAKGEVPSKIGDQKLAFNTAMQHADLLTKATSALSNGDNQTLNSLKNRFATEFGSSGPVTAQAISDAYTREITKMLSAGHLTDSEIGTVGATLNPSKQSPQQMAAVIAAYKALASSKMTQLNQQKQSAINQSQPKNSKANDPLGIR